LSQPSDPTYRAGVVEHPEVEGENAMTRTGLAWSSFQKILRDVEELDILVFPEHIINSRGSATFVPHESQNATPCFQADYEIFLIEASCSARARRMYVVLNLVEKELCANGAGSETLGPCPATGVRYFNTNVVFDRAGKVISRYRKSHLWRQEYYSTSVLRTPDVATFATDFGVTFGHFICFDMLFYEPAMTLVRERGVTDIIYPTYWFSELPFLGAIQLQEGWAYANDVNLLAADGSQPSGRTTGSGIYAGRAGRLTAEIYEEPTTRVLVADVPKRNTPRTMAPVTQFTAQLKTPRHTGVATHRDYNVDIFATELLAADFLTLDKQLCHNAFCCSFAIERAATPRGSHVPAATDVSYRYRIGAYYGNETTVIRVDRSEQATCALFACTDDQLHNCGYIHPSTAEVVNDYHFTKVRIGGLFPAAPRGRRLIMPSSLTGNFLPVSASEFDWTESVLAANNTDRPVQVDMELTHPQNDLLTFAIWANYFTDLPSSHNLDHMQPQEPAGPSTTTDAAPRMSVSLLLLLLGCLSVL
ncbi:hypothetical protein KR054_000443, partial [Drosophila jambulina]